MTVSLQDAQKDAAALLENAGKNIELEKTEGYV